jgi:hypothetical protein
MFLTNRRKYRTDSYQAIATLDFLQPISKSRKKVETREDGSIPANNQRMMDVDSFYGMMMRSDEKCEL